MALSPQLLVVECPSALSQRAGAPPLACPSPVSPRHFLAISRVAAAPLVSFCCLFAPTRVGGERLWTQFITVSVDSFPSLPHIFQKPGPTFSYRNQSAVSTSRFCIRTSSCLKHSCCSLTTQGSPGSSTPGLSLCMPPGWAQRLLAGGREESAARPKLGPGTALFILTGVLNSESSLWLFTHAFLFPLLSPLPVIGSLHGQVLNKGILPLPWIRIIYKNL